MSDYAVITPATGETLATYPLITDDELRDAIGRAEAAYRTHARRTTIAERADLLRRVAALHTERRDELAEIIGREMGKPVTQALVEIDYCALIYTYYADNAEAFLADEAIELLPGTPGRAFVRRTPIGVLLGIMPWNFPYYQVARFAGPNLVLGNTILLKHAPQCPESAAALEQIFADAGFPSGSYVNIYASNEQIEWVIADPRVQGVSLTGSERAGAAVAAIAGKNLKKVVLELGGSDPFIVLSTNDLDAVVDEAIRARIQNAGQSCIAGKRFLIADDIYDAFREQFAFKLGYLTPGDPASTETLIGPLSSSNAADTLSEQFATAEAQGATVVVDAQRDGNFFHPAVIADIPADSDAYTEEFFGPVAALYRVYSEEHAIELANATPFGLGSYLFTEDEEQALRVADAIDAGMVFIGGVNLQSAELPFGGVKRSGFGRELGRYGVDEFANKKLLRFAE